MSMLSFASPLAWQHHFEVDGSVDADDRAHLLHLYGGNLSSVDAGALPRGMSVHRVNLETDAGGDVTAYSRAKVNGRVARVWVDIGTLANTTDITVTSERTAEAVYTGTNLSADTLADPTTAAGVYIWQERIKVVVAQGGADKTGQIWFVVAQ